VVFRGQWTAKKTKEWVLNKAGIKRELEIVLEPFLVLFWPGTTLVLAGCATVFVPEPEHAKYFLCS